MQVSLTIYQSVQKISGSDSFLSPSKPYYWNIIEDQLVTVEKKLEFFLFQTIEIVSYS